MWTMDRLRSFDDKIFAFSRGSSVSYRELVKKIHAWEARLNADGIGPGDRVALIADYSIEAVAVLHALLNIECIVLPVSADDTHELPERLSLVSVTRKISIFLSDLDSNPVVICEPVELPENTVHPLIDSLVDRNEAGLVIFTSGSSGKSKAVLLEYRTLIERYRKAPRMGLRTLLFLKMDHIGGLNTLFSVLLNGGCVVTCRQRSTYEICRCIDEYAVELLPTTPSFLNMLLMSNNSELFDLSSLQMITYGTEVMPDTTLKALSRLLPGVELKQTYGLSELGILSTKSEDSGSRWMKIGGPDVELKVVNGILFIKTRQAMVGYLNADSPFDAEGWYNTGDRVEKKGDYYLVLGRESEIINVAGEKVFPMEIENYLLTLDNVKDVVVYGKRNPVTGNVIVAEFKLNQDEDLRGFKKRVLTNCRENLPAFKVPSLIRISNKAEIVGKRFKKIRQQPAVA